MHTSSELAKHLRGVYFGGNWTSVNFKDTFADIDWQQAITKIQSLNTIATLLFHTNYYVDAITDVLQGNNLNAHDKFSFDHPPILSTEDWEIMVEKTWSKVEMLASLIEKLPEKKFTEMFFLEKYGSYYRNLHGLIEHSHYHLGQIVILKKLIKAS